MMLISALVAPSQLEGLKATLRLFGVAGMTVSATFVDSGPGAPVASYRGKRATRSRLLPRTRMEILASDADTPDLVHVISRATAAPDLPAAGGPSRPAQPPARIWVIRVDHVVRIRTNEWGVDAI